MSSRAQMSARTTVFQFQRCVPCAHVFLGDPPADDELHTYYDEYVLHQGAAAWGRWAPLVAVAHARTDAARVRLVSRYLAPDVPTPVVLDVGCGRPSFLSALTRRVPQARAVGTDWSDAGWRADRPSWDGLELHVGEAPPPTLDGRCDVITLWHLLEHVRHPVTLLQQVRRAARPGATIIVEVPDVESLTARWQGASWAGYHTPRHMSAFSARTLQLALERAGWRSVRVRRNGTVDPYVLWWLGRQERHGWARRSLESRFVPFLAGKLAWSPLTACQSVLPLGIMTAVATAYSRYAEQREPPRASRRFTRANLRLASGAPQWRCPFVCQPRRPRRARLRRAHPARRSSRSRPSSCRASTPRWRERSSRWPRRCRWCARRWPRPPDCVAPPDIVGGRS